MTVLNEHLHKWQIGERFIAVIFLALLGTAFFDNETTHFTVFISLLFSALAQQTKTRNCILTIVKFNIHGSVGSLAVACGQSYA